jgi:hypothetical protein
MSIRKSGVYGYVIVIDILRNPLLIMRRSPDIPVGNRLKYLPVYKYMALRRLRKIFKLNKLNGLQTIVD